jgi:hypothetical protein
VSRDNQTFSNAAWEPLITLKRFIAMNMCCSPAHLGFTAFQGEKPDQAARQVIETRVPHAAAARSSFSSPRITILSASAGNGRCNAFAYGIWRPNSPIGSRRLVAREAMRARGPGYLEGASSRIRQTDERGRLRRPTNGRQQARVDRNNRPRDFLAANRLTQFVLSTPVEQSKFPDPSSCGYD